MSGCSHSFHEPKASENAVRECNNRDMHANKCNKPQHCRVSSHTKHHRVTRRLNVLILIKAHRGC